MESSDSQDYYPPGIYEGNRQKTSNQEGSKWYHTVGDFFNTLKAFIGTNYQALPYAFKNSGLALGVIGVFIIATLTDFCCILLIRCKHIVIEMVCNEAVDSREVELHEVPALRRRLQGSVGYGDLGKRAFGPWCHRFIQILVWFTQLATCVSYFIFLGNTTFSLWPMAVQPINIRNGTYPEQTIDTPAFALKTALMQGVPMLHIENVGEINTGLSSFNHSVCQAYSDDPQQECNLQGDREDTLHRAVRDISAVGQLSDQADENVTMGTFIPTEATTLIPTESTTANSSNITVAPITPDVIYYFSTAPNLILVMLFPLGFFILTSMIRKMRTIAPFSFIATVFLAAGASLVLVKLSMGFSVATGENSFRWIELMTLPVFLGQLISAYEGIGCIIPIESSMEDNYKKMPMLLHLAVYIVFAILCSFGTLGYLRFGQDTQEIIVLNFSGGWLIKVVDIVLIISVLFTYPLQCFPVIEIVESFIFAPGMCCGPRRARLEYDEIGGGGNGTNEVEEERGLLSGSIEASASQVAVVVPQSVPAWKRNFVRLLMTLFILGIAIAMRHHYAYFAAFSGAVGCSLLSYILPCAIYMKLRAGELSIFQLTGFWLIIVSATVASLSAIVVITIKMTTSWIE